MHKEGGKKVETWGNAHVRVFRAESEARRNIPRLLVKLQIDVCPRLCSQHPGYVVAIFRGLLDRY
jgi:hypothetical protein